MKLAPPQNTLQPLPVDVQPDVSQSVQRTASPADIQTIQAVQSAQQNSSLGTQQQSVVPATPYVPMPSSSSLVLWIAIAIAILVAGGLIWLWRSF